MSERPTPPQPEQQQDMPGQTEAMDPRPDHGEHSYVGHGKLTDKKAIITGADSGIGRAGDDRLCPRGRGCRDLVPVRG